jgi:intracellular septation protein
MSCRAYRDLRNSFSPLHSSFRHSSLPRTDAQVSVHVKFIVDLFPVIVFFGVYRQADMYAATVAVMLACAAQTLGYRLFSGGFDRNHVLAVLLVLPFGAMTIVFQDPMFIKWNGTVELWLLAAGLLLSQFFGDKPLIERMMGEGIDLTPVAWRQLNFAWITFFLFSGACNIYVAYNYEEAAWMNFKMFGMTGMSVAFVAAQMIWIMRIMPAPVEFEDGDSPEGSKSEAAIEDVSGG